MRRAWGVLLALSLLIASAAGATETTSAPAGPTDPYDYQARQRLATEAGNRGDYPTAAYHAAWLAWLAPHTFAGSAEAALRDSNLLPRLRRPGSPGTLAILLAALRAHQEVAEACREGTVVSQSLRLQNTVAELTTKAEEAQVALEENDPLARAALADLSLSLDDALRLAGKSARDRKPVLRRALASAEAATRLLPNAPGGYRLAAAAWARSAELSNDPGEWDLAITACAHALSADADDPILWELMWTLHLRAGHWEEAKRWQRRCEQTDSRPEQPAP